MKIKVITFCFCIVMLPSILMCCLSVKSEHPSPAPAAEQTPGQQEQRMSAFQAAYKHSSIIASADADVDGDGIEDTVVIFNNYDDNTYTNVCFVTKAGTNTVTLVPGEPYVFAHDTDSLKMNGAETIVSLFNLKTKKVTEFHLTLTYDPKEAITQITLTSADKKK